MAGYKGHIAGGVGAAALYVGAIQLVPGDVFYDMKGLLTSWQSIAAVFVVSQLFALWPDVDTNSKGQDLYIGIAFISDVCLILSGRLEAAAYLGLISMTPIIGKHRGWTHRRAAAFLVPLPLLVIPLLYRSDLLKVGGLFYGAAVLGYLSHLLLDGLIVRGIGKRYRHHGL